MRSHFSFLLSLSTSLRIQHSAALVDVSSHSPSCVGIAYVSHLFMQVICVTLLSFWWIFRLFISSTACYLNSSIPLFQSGFNSFLVCHGSLKKLVSPGFIEMNEREFPCSFLGVDVSALVLIELCLVAQHYSNVSKFCLLSRIVE